MKNNMFLFALSLTFLTTSNLSAQEESRSYTVKGYNMFSTFQMQKKSRVQSSSEATETNRARIVDNTRLAKSVCKVLDVPTEMLDENRECLGIGSELGMYKSHSSQSDSSTKRIGSFLTHIVYGSDDTSVLYTSRTYESYARQQLNVDVDFETMTAELIETWNSCISLEQISENDITCHAY